MGEHVKVRLHYKEGRKDMWECDKELHGKFSILVSMNFFFNR